MTGASLIASGRVPNTDMTVSRRVRALPESLISSWRACWLGWLPLRISEGRRSFAYRGRARLPSRLLNELARLPESSRRRFLLTAGLGATFGLAGGLGRAEAAGIVVPYRVSAPADSDD